MRPSDVVVVREDGYSGPCSPGASQQPRKNVDLFPRYNCRGPTNQLGCGLGHKQQHSERIVCGPCWLVCCEAAGMGTEFAYCRCFALTRLESALAEAFGEGYLVQLGRSWGGAGFPATPLVSLERRVHPATNKPRKLWKRRSLAEISRHHVPLGA